MGSELGNTWNYLATNLRLIISTYVSLFVDPFAVCILGSEKSIHVFVASLLCLKLLLVVSLLVIYVYRRWSL